MLAEEWKRIVTAFGVAVRDMRRVLGWSQQHLADRAVVSQGTISRLESGNHGDLPFHTVVLVLRTLGVAAQAANLQLSPMLHALLTVVIVEKFEMVEPDPDLFAVMRILHGLLPRQRPAFMAVMQSVSALLDVIDPPGNGEDMDAVTPAMPALPANP